jgi:hypothetical protein
MSSGSFFTSSRLRPGFISLPGSGLIVTVGTNRPRNLRVFSIRILILEFAPSSGRYQDSINPGIILQLTRRYVTKQ